MRDLYTSRTKTIAALEEITWSRIPSPRSGENYGNPNPNSIEEFYDVWLEWSEGSWIKKDGTLPEGFICWDCETTNSTRTLAIASAVHLETGRLFSWFANPAKYKNQTLVSFPDNSFNISHRASFENSFTARNFVPGNPGFKSLCTYAIAAAHRHPGKMGFYRAQPFLPQFRRSSDCSLASLYNLATGHSMDKSAVEVFIDSKGYEWATEDVKKLLDRGIYEAYLRGKSGSKFKKLRLEGELAGHQPIKLPKVLKTALKNKELIHHDVSLPFFSPDTKPLQHSLELINIIQPPLDYQEFVAQLSVFLPKRDPIPDAFAYNIFDTLATAEVIKFLIDDLKEMDDITFAGIVERSTPMFFLDPAYDSQIEIIEEKFQDGSAELDEVSSEWVKEHISVAGDWDGQDWTLNSDRCGADKRGKPVWYDLKKLGFAKTLTAIAIRARFNGIPIKRFKTTTPMQNPEGDYFFRDNPELKPRGIFGLLDNLNPNLSYEENMARATKENCTPWENPFSTDVKAFKGVTNLFSSKLFPLWVDGQLTCDYDVKKYIEKYMSLSYWRSIRKRAFSVKIVETEFGLATSPRTHVNGTVTGRSVDPFFLVLAKHDKNKIGSELQGFFIAPPGYKIVQFDLDSAQARFAALISDAEYARDRDLDRVTLMSTAFSKRIFKGKKSDLSTVAHELGRVAGYDFLTPKSIEVGYAKGKNAQFSLVFGVGARKLSKMVNVAIDVGLKMVESFRGVKDKSTGFYKGGEASDLANGQIRMTRAQFPTGTRAIWAENRKMVMKSAILGRTLPYCLSPVYAGKGDLTTRCNATIQAGDVDFMNYVTSRAALEFNLGTFDGRFSHSVHDAFIWIIKDEDVSAFVEFIKEVHSQCYLKLFRTWNVDLKSVPEDVWYPQTVDVSQRWLKAVKDVTKDNSMTFSFEGFSGIEGDDDWESDEEGSYESLSDYD
jgi:DNA polymerase family A